MEEYIAEEIIEKELQLMDKLLDELAKKESEEYMIEIGKKYKIYAPMKRRLLDKVEVTKILGSAFSCYSIMFDYDTAYDLSDGIIVEQVENEEE